MNTFIKKVVLFPVLMVFMFFSTLFLSGCFCGVQGDKINEVRFDYAAGINIEHKAKFAGLNAQKVLLKQIGLFFLGSVENEELFQTRIRDDYNHDTEAFLVDFSNKKSRFTKLLMPIENLDRTFTISTPATASAESTSETFYIPNTWNYSETSSSNVVNRVITINTLQVILELGISDTIGEIATPSKWQIEINLTNVTARLNDKNILDVIVFQIGETESTYSITNIINIADTTPSTP